MQAAEFRFLPKDVSLKVRRLNLDKSSMKELDSNQNSIEAKIRIRCTATISEGSLLEVMMLFKAQDKEASFLAKVDWCSETNDELGLVLFKLGMQKISLVVEQSKRSDWIIL